MQFNGCLRNHLSCINTVKSSDSLAHALLQNTVVLGRALGTLVRRVTNENSYGLRFKIKENGTWAGKFVHFIFSMG